MPTPVARNLQSRQNQNALLSRQFCWITFTRMQGCCPACMWVCFVRLVIRCISGPWHFMLSSEASSRRDALNCDKFISRVTQCLIEAFSRLHLSIKTSQLKYIPFYVVLSITCRYRRITCTPKQHFLRQIKNQFAPRNQRSSFQCTPKLNYMIKNE